MHSDKLIQMNDLRKMTDREHTIQTPAFSRRSLFKNFEEHRELTHEEHKKFEESPMASNIFDDQSPIVKHVGRRKFTEQAFNCVNLSYSNLSPFRGTAFLSMEVPPIIEENQNPLKK